MLHERLSQILACDWLDVVDCRICIFKKKLGFRSSTFEEEFRTVKGLSYTIFCEFTLATFDL